MKSLIYNILITCLLINWSCEKEDKIIYNYTNCSLSFVDSSDTHPKANGFQQLVESKVKKGIPAVIMLCKNNDGLWIGAAGKADIAKNIDAEKCQRSFIASVTKSFTATSIMLLLEDGKLNIDDRLSEYLDDDIIGKVKNADEATIKQLLNQTSGIADWYNSRYEFDRYQVYYHGWNALDILSYVYGKKPTGVPGESYSYSNTNYLLLGLVIEKLSGMTTGEFMKTRIFDVVGMSNTMYVTTDDIPDNVIRGYADLYGNGTLVESEFLYMDEIGTADGSLVSTVYDLYLFIEALWNGKIVTPATLNLMQDWVNTGEQDEYSLKYGLGIEYGETEYGRVIGHSGLIDGYLTQMNYFPDSDFTFISFTNGASLDLWNLRNDLQKEATELMFQ